MIFRNKILAGLLVFQLVLIVVLFMKNGVQPLKEISLFEGVSADQIQEILVTDNDGKKLSIHKVDGEWQVEIEKGVWYPADNEKVMTMIEKLAGLKSSRLVTRTRGSHKRLKVSDDVFNRRLELSGKDIEPAVLYLGTAPNYKSIHARTAADDNVYLVRDLSAWEVQADANTWWNTSYLDVDPEKLVEVRLQNDNGEFLLTRNDYQDEWKLEGVGKTLDKEKLGNFLEDVSLLSVTEITPPSASKPEGKPLVTLKLKSDKEKFEIKVWDKKDENSDYPVKSSASSFFAMAGKYAVDDILKFTQADFIKAPAEKE